MKCKKCKREYESNDKRSKYCSSDCRVNHFRNTESKWDKILKTLKEFKDLDYEDVLSGNFILLDGKYVKKKI